MTSEEMMFDLTKVALKELIRSNTEDITSSTISSSRRQKEIGVTASNLARHTFERMLINLAEIQNYE